MAETPYTGLRPHLGVNSEHLGLTAPVETLDGKAWGILALHCRFVETYSTAKLELLVDDLGEGGEARSWRRLCRNVPNSFFTFCMSFSLGLTEMRKNSIQVKERPLVYPR